MHLTRRRVTPTVGKASFNIPLKTVSDSPLCERALFCHSASLRVLPRSQVFPRPTLLGGG
jgi:hypothetical protein